MAMLPIVKTYIEQTATLFQIYNRIKAEQGADYFFHQTKSIIQGFVSFVVET
jgi:hypothetical protein